MRRGDFIVLLVVLAITAIRYALILAPVELFTEEAQYWLWAQDLKAGYFTKPPMIAWIIAMTTGLIGDTEFGVRAAAPFIQMVSALLMWRIARQAGEPEHANRAAWIASLIWITLPAGAVAGYIISTDSPMLMFLLAMLAVIAPVARGAAIGNLAWLVAGIFFGLAMMSKYAAIYILMGLALWWITSRNARRVIAPHHIGVFMVGALAALAPNIIWNIGSGFATVAHLGDNANLGGAEISLSEVAWFWAGQVAITGFLFIAVMVAVIASMLRRQYAFWLWLAAPALTIITVQAFLSEANANWAAASWPPLLILTAIWIAGKTRFMRRTLITAAIGVNLVIVLVVLLVVSNFDNPRWEAHGRDLAAFMTAHDSDTAITTRRRDIAHLIWALRHTDAEVALIDPDGIPSNHYEAEHPFRPQPGRRSVLVVERDLNPDNFPMLEFTGTKDSSVLTYWTWDLSEPESDEYEYYKKLHFHLVIEK